MSDLDLLHKKLISIIKLIIILKNLSAGTTRARRLSKIKSKESYPRGLILPPSPWPDKTNPPGVYLVWRHLAGAGLLLVTLLRMSGTEWGQGSRSPASTQRPKVTFLVSQHNAAACSTTPPSASSSSSIFSNLHHSNILDDIQ